MSAAMKAKDCRIEARRCIALARHWHPMGYDVRVYLQCARVALNLSKFWRKLGRVGA